MLAAQPAPTVVDSLLERAQSDIHDSLRSEAYLYLVFHHRTNKEAALAYAQEGILLARKANAPRMLFNLYNQIGVVHDLKSDYAKALEAYAHALQYAEQMKREDMLAMVHTNIGLTYSNLGASDKALEHLFEALNHYSDSTKSISYRASTYNNIGIVYSYKQERKMARAYFERAIELIKSQDDLYNLAAFISNLANEDREEGNYELAIQYFKEAYDIHQEINNTYGKGLALYNMGISYQNLKNFGKAEYYLRQSALLRKASGDRFGLSMTYNMLSSGYRETQQLGRARLYSDSALALANELGSALMMFRVYRQRWYLFREMGDFKTALEMHVLYKEWSDSLNTEASDKRLKEVEVRYDVAQKDQQLAISQVALREQAVLLERRKITVFALSLLLMLVLLIALLIRQRSQHLQQKQMADARALMQQQQLEAVISAQEAEKTRFARDLHDGMGQLLTALKLSIEVKATESGDKSLQLLDELYKEVRHLAYNIMPQTLLRKGLAQALDELMRRLEQSSKGSFKCSSSFFGTENRLPLPSEQLLYRVVQELLTNVMKYAEASHISLNMVIADGQLSLMLEDNGKGFNTALLQGSKGHGWANIQTRLQMLGAEIDVDSMPGRPGTTFSITMRL